MKISWIDFFGDIRETSLLFQHFKIIHIVTLLLILIATIWFISWIATQRRKQKKIRIILTILLSFSILLHYIWVIAIGRYSIMRDLPFTLCYIISLLAIISLWIKSELLFEVIFHIGIFASIRAILLPDLLFSFPHIKFIQFYLMHLLILLCLFFQLEIDKFQLTFRSVFKSWFGLLFYCVIIFLFNRFTGANYLYLSRKPFFQTELDYLGEWPYYFLSLSVILLLLFLLIHIAILMKKRIGK